MEWLQGLRCDEHSIKMVSFVSKVCSGFKLQASQGFYKQERVAQLLALLYLSGLNMMEGILNKE